MKPRTKIQKEVAVLMAKLPPINENQRRWAKENCFPDIGYVCKGEVWCSHCSKTFIKPIPELGVSIGTEKQTDCPYCGKRLNLENSRAQKKEFNSYMTIVTTIGGWQVLRHISIYKRIYKNQTHIHAENPNFFLSEAVQQWINQDGKNVTVALPRNFSGYMFNWIYSRPLEIRDIDRLYSYEAENYNINGNVYPIKKVIPIIKRNGYKGYIPNRCSMADLFNAILSRSYAETLIKEKQFGLLEYGIIKGGIPLSIWPSVKIAIRNGYTIKEAALWVDMIEALLFLHKDVRNSHYVCPKYIHQAHDKWISKKKQVQEKISKEKRIKEARIYEEQYRERISKFFGITMVGDGINIKVIKSVADMAEEGSEMHHCVYSNGYYKRKESLILSARDNEGNRLETVEVNLVTMKVVQCFGKYNSITPYHDRILELVNNNMSMIAKAM